MFAATLATGSTATLRLVAVNQCRAYSQVLDCAGDGAKFINAEFHECVGVGIRHGFCNQANRWSFWRGRERYLAWNPFRIMEIRMLFYQTK